MNNAFTTLLDLIISISSQQTVVDTNCHRSSSFFGHFR